MKLYFTCPIADEDFETDEYFLHDDHRIAEDEHGRKQLMGYVSLHSACPFCGRKHRYEVKDVMCPLNRGENEG